MKTVTIVYEDHETGRRITMSLTKEHLLELYAKGPKWLSRFCETALSEMNPHQPKEKP